MHLLQSCDTAVTANHSNKLPGTGAAGFTWMGGIYGRDLHGGLCVMQRRTSLMSFSIIARQLHHDSCSEVVTVLALTGAAYRLGAVVATVS